MSGKLISVIVPLYNYERYIADCIRSITDQDYSNFEVFVVDDASTDNSLQIARSLQSSKVKVISQLENKGYSAAKNAGIRSSQGDLIVTLDADDMLTAGSLRVRAAAIEATGAPFVHGWAYEINAKHTLAGARNKVRKRRGRKNQIHAQCVMLTRDMHKRYGLYDEDLRSKADKEMWFRLIPRVRIVKIPDVVAYYRRHGKSMQAFRKRNPAYNKSVKKLFREKVNMRKESGLNSDNTEMLET